MTPWLWALGDAVLHYLAPLLAGVVVGTAIQARFGVRPNLANVLMVLFVAASVAALFVPAPPSARIGLSLLAGLAAGMAIELEPAPRRRTVQIRSRPRAREPSAADAPPADGGQEGGGASRAARH